MRGWKLLICGLATFVAAGAQAAECPGNPNALGTSRTIVVDPTEHPRVGSMQYRESVPLEDHEIVITFDDGPLPPHSTRVLDILASECVKVTYFLVGSMERNFPDVVRRIRAEGHTIGTHSEHHPLTFHKMPVERAEQEISDGIASVTWALNDGSTPAPFFRVPGLLRADGVEQYLASQHLMTWSADFLADDWTKIGPAQVYARAIQRIEAAHKGILLLHDIHERTVEALPNLLHELKRRGYRIVQVVPATADLPKTASDPRQWIVRSARLWPQVPIVGEADAEAVPELSAPSPNSFGVADLSDPNSLVRDPLPVNPIALARHRATSAQGHIPLPPESIWQRVPAPNVTGLAPSARPQLIAPSRQSLGYPESAAAPFVSSRRASIEPALRTVPAAVPPKAAVDLVPASPELDVRRLLPTGLGGDDRTGTLPANGVRPRSTENMPRGAFP
jgi:peptidoglycan/xylan/chitin deacetylase (PgdA/CDA1 family)